MDLTHSKIMIVLAFLVSGYVCSTSHTIGPFTIGCKLKLFMPYSCSGSIYMKQTKIKQNSVNFQN